MAQVIRKYLDGGKAKPTIIKIDGKDYNYDDLERNIWGNFDEHARRSNWDSSTQLAVRDYLTYSLAGLKSGDLTYGHNTMTGVSPEYATDGTFNTTGKGLLKRDITNDKRAGANLGTAYLNLLMTANGVMKEYKAPELKNIGASFTQDVLKKITDSAFGGNEQAFSEGWTKLSPQDRYTIFKQAVSDLSYNPDEYKDVDLFNTRRTALLDVLSNPYDETAGISDLLNKAYSILGGYGLDKILTGVKKDEDSEEEVKVPTIEEERKAWRNEAITAGARTELAIADYIKKKELEYNQAQKQFTTDLKDAENAQLFSNASQSLDNYIKWSKGNLYKRYNNARISRNTHFELIKENVNGLGNYYHFDNFSTSSLLKTIKNMGDLLRNGKVNAYMWRGLLKYLIDNKVQSYTYKDGSGRGVYVVEGTEDLNSESVAVIDGRGNVRLASIHDFPEIYGKKFSKKFRELYKNQYSVDLPQDWELKIQLNKNGGILKAQDGAAFFRAMQGTSSRPDMYQQILNNLNELKNAEIQRANSLGISVEEMKQRDKEEAKKQAKVNAAIKHNNATGKSSFGAREYAVLTGLVGDLTAFIGSIAGGAADPITWAGAATSIGGHTTADWMDDSLTTYDKIKHTVMNLGLAGVSLIPEIGAAGPAIKIGKTIIQYGPLLYDIFNGSIPEAAAVIKKKMDGKDLTNNDYVTLFNATRTLLASGTAAKNQVARYRATKPGEAGKPKVTLQNEEKGQFTKELSSEQYNKVKGKSAKEVEEILGKDFLNGATVAEGSKRYRLFGKRKAITTDDSPSWFSRNIRNRQLKSIEEVKPNERRDWLRALGKPMNARSERFYNWRLNLHMPSWMPSFSRTRMTDELFRRYSGANVKVPKTEIPRDNSMLRLYRANLFATKRENFLLDDSRLIKVLRKHKIPQTGKHITKKPTLVKMLESNKEVFNNTDKAKITPYLAKDGTIDFYVTKVPKSFQNRILSLDTEINTATGRKTIGEAFAKGETIKFDMNYLKKGGTIFLNNVLIKYQQGGQIPKYQTGNLFSNVRFGEGSNWRTNVYANIEVDLLERLKNAKTPEEKQRVIDAYNKMQTRHSSIYSANTTNGLLNNSVAFDLNTSDYQNDIIKDYNFVNAKGIKSQWINGAYDINYNRNVSKDGYGESWDKSYAADGLYGGQTDDRRLLGRKGDFDENSEDYKALVKRWQDAGADIYLDSNTNYYMLKPTSSLSTTGSLLNAASLTYTDPVTGEVIDRKTGKVLTAVGNSNVLDKSKVQKIGDDVLNYIKNINPADAIALGRALWGLNVNNKVTELTKQMGVALLDPLHLTAILHGDYNAKMLAQLLAGKINAAAQRPISSDAGTQYAARLEAALKATEALRQGNALDSEMYWKTLQILNLVNNENAEQDVATGNENRGKVTAIHNNRLLVEAARLAANFEQIWQPFLEGFEKRGRDEDVLRRLAEIDNWKYKITSEHEKLNDLIMEGYRNRQRQEAANWKNNPKYNEYNGDFYSYFAREISPEYLKRIKENSLSMYDRLYSGLSEYYGYTPFQLKRTPALATPGINDHSYLRNIPASKQGGTLSAADRQALKTTNEINKNIRQAARETYKNIREDKREHRKAMALVSQLSADLIKKAIGAK